MQDIKSSVNYYVAYQVPDWKRRYHVVANYSQGSISLIVNGENVVSNTVDSLDTEFSFSLTNSVFKTIGDDDYKVTVDAVALYKYNISQTRAQDHLDLSRKTVVKRNYFNSNNQLFSGSHRPSHQLRRQDQLNEQRSVYLSDRLPRSNR